LTRAQGIRIKRDDFPVAVISTVGMPAWTLPYVNIVDSLGLNDYVIARAKVSSSNENRQMAHDRRPPEGYIGAFRANVRIEPNGHLVIEKRIQELTAQDIIQIEKKWREKTKKSA